MKIVRLPFKDAEQYPETQRGIEISRWLKSQGLTIGRDYTWMVSTKDRELHFLFNGEAEAWATLISMRDL